MEGNLLQSDAEFFNPKLTLSEVEGMLEDALVLMYQQWDHKPETTYIKQDQHKWRASSALQKSIRRGNVEVARRMANGLHGLDPEYVWRRLCTIAIEDVGVGDPVLTAAFLWLSGKMAWKNKVGVDRKWLLMMVELLADAIHDRNACDLLVWADLDPGLDGERLEAEEMMKNGVSAGLTYVYTDEKTMIAHRMIAGWVLAGTKHNPGVGFKNDGKGNPNFIVEASKAMGHPALIQSIVRSGFSKQREGMPMAFPLIWEAAKDVHHAHLNSAIPLMHADDEFVQMPMIGNYPSEAFDWHNAEGKKALGYFRKACEPVKAWLDDEAKIPYALQIEVLGTLVFRLEGHQVSKRLVYDGSTDLVELAEWAALLGNRIPEEHAEKGMKLMRANMPVLHYARQKIVNVLPPGYKTDKPESKWV